jgi:hypothetical protein
MKIYFGAGVFMKDLGFTSAEDVKPWLDALLENKGIINGLDSAVAYCDCEVWLGQLDVGSQYGFPVSTKLPGGVHPFLVSNKENILAQARESLSKVGVKQVSAILRLPQHHPLPLSPP